MEIENKTTTITTAILIACIALVCVTCTYSVNIVQSQGKSDDVIDEQQTAQPQISLPIQPM